MDGVTMMVSRERRTRGSRRRIIAQRVDGCANARDECRTYDNVRSKLLKYQSGKSGIVDLVHESSFMPRVVVFGSSNTDMTVRLPRLPVAGADDPGQHVLRPRPAARGPTRRSRPAAPAPRSSSSRPSATTTWAGRRWSFIAARGSTSAMRGSSRGSSSGVALIFVGDDGENMIGVASGANLRLDARGCRPPAGLALPRGRRAAGRPGDPRRDRDPRHAARLRRRGCSRS